MKLTTSKITPITTGESEAFQLEGLLAISTEGTVNFCKIVTQEDYPTACRVAKHCYEQKIPMTLGKINMVIPLFQDESYRHACTAVADYERSCRLAERLLEQLSELQSKLNLNMEGI